MLDLSAVRGWAAQAGIEIGKRGRVSRAVLVDYLLAHQAEARTIAKALNVPTPARGRLSRATVDALV